MYGFHSYQIAEVREFKQYATFQATWFCRLIPQILARKQLWGSLPKPLAKLMTVLQNLCFDTIIPQFVSLKDGKATGLIVIDDTHPQ